jgi:hypothetical protein
MCFALFVTVLTLSRGAHADAIMPPPDDCPDGLQGGSSHGGPFCEVVACSEARFHPSDCPPESYCEHRRYCVHERPGFSIDGGFTETVATHACETVSDCDPGDRCEDVEHCVPFAASRQGRMRIVSGALAVIATIAALAVALVVVRRRRAASRS